MVEKIDELREIISLYIHNGAFSISLDMLEKYDVLDELLANYSIIVRQIEGPAIDTNTFTIVNCTTLIADLKDAFYNNYKELLDKHCGWDEILYLKHSNPLCPMFLDPRIIQIIKDDPKYLLNWSEYRGTVCSEYEKGHLPVIYVKDLCWAYDTKNDLPLLFMFLDEFLKMGEIEKGLFRPFLIDDDSDNVLCSQNITNLIDGEVIANDEICIYDVIIKGIQIFNNLTENTCGIRVFKIEDKIPSAFRSIIYPTKRNYEDFISDVAVMLVDSINEKGLKKYIWDNRAKIRNTVAGVQFEKENPDIFDKKDVFSEKHSIAILELFLGSIPIFDYKRVAKILRSLWDERSAIHHSFHDNEYDVSYYEKQDDWLFHIYQMFYVLIDCMDSNREVCTSISSYECFETQFGHHGGVREVCGFNRPKRFADKYGNAHQ